MSKHAASPSFKAIFIESAHKELFGDQTPDRNGKHRMVESFNPMTGITTSFEATK